MLQGQNYALLRNSIPFSSKLIRKCHVGNNIVSSLGEVSQPQQQNKSIAKYKWISRLDSLYIIYVLNTVTILEFFTRITAYRIKGLHFVWNVSKEASTTVGQLAITHPDSLDEIKFAEFLFVFFFFCIHSCLSSYQCMQSIPLPETTPK